MKMQSFQARGISATRNDTALIAALLRDWQHKGSARGFCAVTSAKEAYASCTTAEKGSFALSTHELATAREHVDSAWTATAACISLCLGCANCNFISVSSRWNDCSWFARCDLDRLHTDVDDFRSGRVDRGRWTPLLERTAASRCDSPAHDDVVLAAATAGTHLLPASRFAACQKSWLQAATARRAQARASETPAVAVAFGWELGGRLTMNVSAGVYPGHCEHHGYCPEVRPVLDRVSTRPRPSLPLTDDVCRSPPPTPSFTESFAPIVRETMQPWSGRRQLLDDVRRGFALLSPWCRVQACVVDGALWVASPHDLRLGSTYRANAFLLGMAHVLRRHHVEDVCVIHNCMDTLSNPRRTRSQNRVREPTPMTQLVLSYLSHPKRPHVLWPDHMMWGGYPENHVLAWPSGGPPIYRHARTIPFGQRLDRVLYDATVRQLDGDGAIKPLRLSLLRCLRADGSGAQALRGFLDVQRPIRSALERLETRTVLGPDSWQFRYMCHWRHLLLLSGTSGWINRLPYVLACGSAAVLAVDEAAPFPKAEPGEGQVDSLVSKLLLPGVDFVPLNMSSSDPLGALCEDLAAALDALRQRPRLAECIGRNGRVKMETLLTHELVVRYMAAVMRHVARLQRGEEHATYVRARAEGRPLFARVNVTACLELELRPLVQHECVERVVREAIAVMSA